MLSASRFSFVDGFGWQYLPLSLPTISPQNINTAALEGPSATRQDQGLPLRGSDLESVCGPGVGLVVPPCPAVSADELVHDRAFRLFLCLIQR